MFYLNRGHTEVEITKELMRLRHAEPPVSPNKRMMRSAFMGYELREIQYYTQHCIPGEITSFVGLAHLLNTHIGVVMEYAVKASQPNIPDNILDQKKQNAHVSINTAIDLLQILRDNLSSPESEMSIEDPYTMESYSPESLAGLKEVAKLGMADLITQCRMLCLDTPGMDFDEIQKLGLDHLKERHEDFKKDGFAEINFDNARSR